MDKPTDYESVFRSSNLLRGTKQDRKHMKGNIKKIIPVIFSAAIFSSAFILLILRNSENPENELQISPRTYLYNEKFGEAKRYDYTDVSGNSFIKNVRINKTTGASEPKIVCNPQNKNIFAVTANDFSLSGNSARIYVSENMGLDWQAKEIPLSPKFKESTYSDPWIDYDTDGNLYFICVQRDAMNDVCEAIYCSCSKDNGTTWKISDNFIDFNAKGNILFDKPKICTDKSSSFKNVIYATWIEIRGLTSSIMFSTSTEGGNTFTSPVSIENQDVDYCSITTDTKGYIFVAFLKDENKICVKKSTNSGQSWIKEPGCIDIRPSGRKYENQFIIKKTENKGIRINSEPNMSVTRENDLLITYSAKENNNDLSDVYFAKIKNNTDEVTVPVKVNSDKTTNDQYLPAITTDESNNIFILYQDSRNDVNNVFTESYISVSTDGGLSFKDEILSTSGFNPASVAVGKYFGDYNSCTISEGKFIGVWTDGRNSNFDVYAGIYNIKDLIESKQH